MREPRYEKPLLEAMDDVFRMRYSDAEGLLLADLPAASPAQAYFAGLACVNRFEDLGDTAALRRAENFWDKLENDPSPLYRGLAEFQLSYVAAIRGSQFRAAKLAWSARGRLLPLRDQAEAKAALNLFDYYRAQFLERLRFLPFLHPESDLILRKLDSASDSSLYLGDVFRASAFWIHFDRKEYAACLRIADGFLARYPENRLVRQMRGDALFREGKPEEAREVYESLFREYSALRDTLPSTCLPIGYFSATGNLARIYAALGRREESKKHLTDWQRADSLGLTPWLPASLRRELAKLSAS